MGKRLYDHADYLKVYGRGSVELYQNNIPKFQYNFIKLLMLNTRRTNEQILLKVVEYFNNHFKYL